MFIRSFNLNLKLCGEKMGISLLLLSFGLIIFLFTDVSPGAIFSGAFLIAALYQMMRGFGQLYIESLSGNEAHSIMILPLSAKQMAAGKITVGGIWIAAFSGVIAVLAVILYQNGVSTMDFKTILDNFVDYLTIRGNSPLAVGFIFTLIPVSWLLSCLTVSVAVLALSLKLAGKKRFHYGIWLILLGTIPGIDLILFGMFHQFAWKWSMLAVILFYIAVLAMVSGILYRYAYRYLDQCYDLH